MTDTQNSNTPAPIQGTGRLLRRTEVERETGLSCSSIYRLIDEGKFPRPRRTGHRRVAWPSADIEAWKQSRPIADPSEI